MSIQCNKRTQELKSVVIRFAGDSGDGMQLTGNQFSDTSAEFGNDLATLPDYPAEIRAPIGTVGGVSSFQIQFSSLEIRTPGDEPDVLVAMNAAALKKNLPDIKSGGYIYADTHGFDEKNLKLSKYDSNPLYDGSLNDYRVIAEDFTALTLNALKDIDIHEKEARRCKNIFALGMMYWLYNRSLEHTKNWLDEKFINNPIFAQANHSALIAGHNYAETIELFSESYNIRKANLAKGSYRKISGNEATALGMLTASEIIGRQLFLGSYPITPASNILHAIAKYKNFNVVTFQAEDEIAAASSALGASYAGSLGVTSTSGPGLCLKSETINLAFMAELPLVIINVQRGGPSTGLPTQTEQSDLLFALFGRNGDSLIPVIAPASPSDCFNMALEAARIATTFMTPVIFLSDGYLGNGTEPWAIPALEELPKWKIKETTQAQGEFKPYLRDKNTQARDWVIPGTKGMEHRIGGLEKENITGNVSYDSKNHELMTYARKNKIANITNFIPEQKLLGSTDDKLLVLSWGGTFGSVSTAVEELRAEGKSVAHVHIKYLNPLPKNIEKILKAFDNILVCELNTGQLAQYINGLFSVNAKTFNQIQGKPFKISKLKEIITSKLEEK